MSEHEHLQVLKESGRHAAADALLAVIAERDALRAELEALKNKEPKTEARPEKFTFGRGKKGE